MFQLYSKGCEYTLRALVEAEKYAKGKSFSAKAICRKARIPESFTRKIFQSLVRAGVLKAAVGRGGGYWLSRDPAQMDILSVVQAVDGHDTFEHCIMGKGLCGKDRICPLHDLWFEGKSQLLALLRSKTLRDISPQASSNVGNGSQIKKKEMKPW